ncbi:lysophospholipase-like protein 1 [Orussus abietinus]|uniref:lysophospholipase-like protein 1 n=1 Tax=Orussus abietinus TaxID=222816 RepID=UPI000626E900|nr:lysophospholipase-like protein 1 [Orussus abietinus]
MSGMIRIPAMKIVEATKKHTATLILFHGSGGNGDDMKEWVDMMNREELKFPHIKIIYPTAPPQRYTPNGGMISNVWFDRKDISMFVPEEVESVNLMCEKASELIEKETEIGIPESRIVLGGFSMGGALAMYMSYKYKKSVAGCVAMSTFLNVNSMVYEELKSDTAKNVPPLLQFHGANDALVPFTWGEETCKVLKSLGVNVEFVRLKNAYHELAREEIAYLKKWVLNILPEVTS